MRLDRRPNGLATRFELYREQERGQLVNQFEVTAAVNKSPSSSDSISASDLTTVFVAQNITRKRPGSSLISLETSVTALLQASRPYFRLPSRSNDLIRASSSDSSEPVLDGTVQLICTDPPYKLRLLRKARNSADDNRSLRDTKNIAELISDFLRPGGHGTLFCTAQQLSDFHTFSCAPKSTQNDGLSSFSASNIRGYI